MNGPLLLGMDGGGTVTNAWIADAGGNVLGRGRAGPSNIKAVGAKSAMHALDLAILAAFRDAGLEVAPVEVSCLGLAGFDRPGDKEWLRAWSAESSWARRLVLVNDGDLVIAAGTPEGWGAAVIAGTGSIAVGRDRDGRSSRAGGWGHLIGDEGSAFAVAVAALRRVARLADGRDPGRSGDDPLTRRMFQALNVDAIEALVPAVYGEGFDRARIASLAPAVVEASREDEAVAVDILDPAARELAAMVRAVARNHGWHGGHLPLAMAGGFLLRAERVAAGVLDDLDAAGYRVEAAAVPEPVRGALVLARRELAG